MTPTPNNRVAFVTVGCKLNYSESSTLAREFLEGGFTQVPPNSEADIYVINSCSVTENAEKKCRNLIRRVSRLNSDAVVAVTGCYAQLNPSQILKIEGVDLVMGTNYKGDLFKEVLRIRELKERDKGYAFSCDISSVDSIFPAYSSDERTRSFFKVQEGCDYKCSYCTIPLARGASRNLPIDLLVKEAKEVAAKGIKELVLTGVNTGDFGKSSGESFIDLLRAIVTVEGIERVRVSSIEPNLLTEEIIELFSCEAKLMPHFHLPLQSGSNKILAAMKRRYSRELFAQKVASIKSRLPFAFIGVDLIVGFPGEGREEFEESYRFIEECAPSFLHLFPFSKRRDTPAYLFEDVVDEKEKRERINSLTTLSQRLHDNFLTLNRGREELVLVEGSERDSMLHGYSRNYIRVEIAHTKGVIGQIVKVTL
ncbi:MAG: tRNA (N(6)-L-threonylcarbamoyladenosine(37)-C(2))-methylthiotransferase MtaB [Bacteroidales bacterium]